MQQRAPVVNIVAGARPSDSDENRIYDEPRRHSRETLARKLVRRDKIRNHYPSVHITGIQIDRKNPFTSTPRLRYGGSIVFQCGQKSLYTYYVFHLPFAIIPKGRGELFVIFYNIYIYIYIYVYCRKRIWANVLTRGTIICLRVLSKQTKCCETLFRRFIAYDCNTSRGKIQTHRITINERAPLRACTANRFACTYDTDTVANEIKNVLFIIRNFHFKGDSNIVVVLRRVCYEIV
jgi:hypothetical protein